MIKVDASRLDIRPGFPGYYWHRPNPSIIKKIKELDLKKDVVAFDFGEFSMRVNSCKFLKGSTFFLNMTKV